MDIIIPLFCQKGAPFFRCFCNKKKRAIIRAEKHRFLPQLIRCFSQNATLFWTEKCRFQPLDLNFVFFFHESRQVSCNQLANLGGLSKYPLISDHTVYLTYNVCSFNWYLLINSAVSNRHISLPSFKPIFEVKSLKNNKS